MMRATSDEPSQDVPPLRVPTGWNAKTGAVFFSWIVYCVYFIFLPSIAKYANRPFFNGYTSAHHLGPICTLSVYTPGVSCWDPRLNLSELAAEENRTVMCGCGEGLIGDHLCPFNEGGWIISWFLNPSAAGCLFLALAWPSMKAQWWYTEFVVHTFQPTYCQQTWLVTTLYLAQMSAGGFVIVKCCLAVGVHVLLACASMSFYSLHYYMVFWLNCWKPKPLPLIVMVVTCLVCMIGNWLGFFHHHTGEEDYFWRTWAWYVGEAIQLVTLMGQADIMLIVANPEVPSWRKTQANLELMDGTLLQ